MPLDSLEVPLNSVLLSNSLGNLYYLLGSYDEAQNQLNSAIEISSRIPYPLGHGEAFFCLGKVHRERGELQDALHCFRQAITKFRQAEDPLKADSVGSEMEKLIESLRAEEGYNSPVSTEGSMHSARSRLSSEASDDEASDDDGDHSEDNEQDVRARGDGEGANSVAESERSSTGEDAAGRVYRSE
ncbi:unnamed protein product [Peniophora sp. CBMAI 1063]|nr:unnamed protein product [Peniophora sp. CBMAI 1063]